MNINPYSPPGQRDEEIVRAELVEKPTWPKKVQTAMLLSVVIGTYFLVSAVFYFQFIIAPEILLVVALVIAYVYRWVGKFR